MELLKITGRNLRRMREESGLTQEQLAAQLGAQKQNISAIENGRRGLSSAMITHLCEIFACSPSEFFKLESNHHEGIDKLLEDEIGKMDRAGKATLYAKAVAMNTMDATGLRRRVEDRLRAAA